VNYFVVIDLKEGLGGILQRLRRDADSNSHLVAAWIPVCGLTAVPSVDNMITLGWFWVLEADVGVARSIRG